MDIIITCNCGKELQIVSTSCTNNYVELTTIECCDCEQTNYEAGEADAKQ